MSAIILPTEAQEARDPNEIPVVSDGFALRLTPIRVSASSVHRRDYDGMQVAIGFTSGPFNTTLWMDTDEARRLAQAMVAAADHFDAEAAKAGVR